MINYREYEKIRYYLFIDLVILRNKKNKHSKTLFKLKNEVINTKNNIIDQSDALKIIQNKLF